MRETHDQKSNELAPSVIDERLPSAIDERWARFPEFEDGYEISTLGRVRNRKTGRILQPRESDGRVALSLAGKTYGRTTGSAVLKAFSDPAEWDPAFAKHRNGRAGDNRLHNLYWAPEPGRPTLLRVKLIHRDDCLAEFDAE